MTVLHVAFQNYVAALSLPHNKTLTLAIRIQLIFNMTPCFVVGVVVILPKLSLSFSS